jgi:hypothetical protein
VLRIRIILGKLDPDPDQRINPDPDPHQSEKVEVLEGHFGALEDGGSESGKN